MSEVNGHSHPDAAAFSPFAGGHFSPRSRSQWIAFLPSVLLCALSWLAGGIPRLTDVGFLLLTVACFVFFISELWNFSRRFGIGGIVLYLGTLIWFCHDYFNNWFLRSDVDFPIRAVTVAKAAFLYSLFIMCMTVGLRTRGGRLLQRIILSVPEPGSQTAYFLIVLLIFAFGIFPFMFFSYDPFFTSLYHGAFSSWVGPVRWTTGRTGNLNYSWGAYLAQVIQTGGVGGIFAAFFAIMVSTQLWTKIIAWAIWGYWCMYAFNDGRRGPMLFMFLPPIGLLFIKYHSDVAAVLRKISFKAYLTAGALGLVLLVIVQIQGTFRAIGLDKTDLSQIDLIKNQGNSMFSEGLRGYDLIPEQHDFFSNNYWGQSIVMPYVDTVWNFVIGPIPRALWTTKPVDPLWEWYNKVITGDYSGRVGTTVSKGLVGTWYFNYGICGVLEGGFLVGWLMGLCERCLQNSEGRPMGLLMSLGFAVWLFRSFRDFAFNDLYGFIIGAIVLALFSYSFRIFNAPKQPAPDYAPEFDPAHEASLSL